MLDGSGIRGIVKDELETYLGHNPPPAGQNMLEFWKSQKSILPKLSSVAKKVLGTTASSTSSEQLFSHAGLILTEKRTSLSAEKLDDLLFVRWKPIEEKCFVN